MMNLSQNLVIKTMRVGRTILSTNYRHTGKVSISCHTSYFQPSTSNTSKPLSFIPRYFFWSKKNPSNHPKQKTYRWPKSFQQRQQLQEKQQQPTYKQLSPLVKEVNAFLQELEKNASHENKQQYLQIEDRQKISQKITLLRKFILEQKYEQLLNATLSDWYNLFRMQSQTTSQRKRGKIASIIWSLFPHSQKKDSNISCETIIIEKIVRLFLLTPFIDQTANHQKCSPKSSQSKKMKNLTRSWNSVLEMFEKPKEKPANNNQNEKQADKIVHEEVQKLLKNSMDCQATKIFDRGDSSSVVDNHIQKVIMVIMNSIVNSGKSSSQIQIPSQVTEIIQKIGKDLQQKSSIEKNSQSDNTQKEYFDSIKRQKQAIFYLIDQIQKGELNTFSSLEQSMRTSNKFIVGLLILFLSMILYEELFDKEKKNQRKEWNIMQMQDQELIKAKNDFKSFLDEISTALQDTREQKTVQNQKLSEQISPIASKGEQKQYI